LGGVDAVAGCGAGQPHCQVERAEAEQIKGSRVTAKARYCPAVGWAVHTLAVSQVARTPWDEPGRLSPLPACCSSDGAAFRQTFAKG